MLLYIRDIINFEISNCVEIIKSIFLEYYICKVFEGRKNAQESKNLVQGVDIHKDGAATTSLVSLEREQVDRGRYQKSTSNVVVHRSGRAKGEDGR